MEITLDSVIEAARLRVAAVTGEVAGYVVLLTLQQLTTGPCAIGAASISLTDAGDIGVRSLGPADPHELETTLRRLLATLVALCPSAAPAIKSAAERPAGGGLLALESELLTALVPINHAASRRALARLYRETQKADRAAFAAVSRSSAAGSALEAVRPKEPTPLRASGLTPEATKVGEARPASLPSMGRSAVRVELGDLDIDVDVDAEVAIQDTGGSMQLGAHGLSLAEPDSRLDTADAASVELEVSDAGSAGSVSELTEGASDPPAMAQAEVDVGCRSDLRELLASFLSHTRSEERMTRELRQMIGVDPSRESSSEERGSLFGHGSGARH